MENMLRSSTSCAPDAVKCANFFRTLLRLSQRSLSNEHDTATADIKKLIQDVILNVISPLTFVVLVQTAFNSAAQPHLLPFLEKALPQLRYAMETAELVIEGIDVGACAPPLSPSLKRSLEEASNCCPEEPATKRACVETIQTHPDPMDILNAYYAVAESGYKKLLDYNENALTQFLSHADAPTQVLRFLPLRDWLTLERVCIGWNAAVHRAWKARLNVNFKQFYLSRTAAAFGQRGEFCLDKLQGEISRKTTRQREQIIDALQWLQNRQPRLRALSDLDWSAIKSRTTDNITMYIDGFSHLNSLDLDYSSGKPSFTAQDFHDLLTHTKSSLTNLSLLRFPEFENSFRRPRCMTDTDLVTMDEALSALSKLSSFKLHLSSHDPRPWDLVLGLGHPDTLRKLNIKGCMTAVANMETFVEFFSRCSSLEELDLFSEHEDPVCSIKPELLLSIPSQLRALSLRNIEKRVTVNLFQKPQALPHLQTLSIYSRQVEDNASLIKLLPDSCPHLQKLSTAIYAPVENVVRPLQRLSNLQYLSLTIQTKFPGTHEDLKELFALPALRDVSIIYYSFLRRLATRWYFKLISILPSRLERLTWDCRYFSNAHLKEMLQANKGASIQHLALKSTTVSDSGLRLIPDYCKELKSFEFRASPYAKKLSAAGLQDVIDNCKKLKEIHLPIMSRRFRDLRIPFGVQVIQRDI